MVAVLQGYGSAAVASRLASAGLSAKRKKALGYAWGIATPFLCTLIDWPLQHWLGPASILMTYLLGVFLVASRFGRGASIAASLLSAPAFAFYFARPIFSFAIHDLENIVGLVVMIVVSNVTGSLLEKFQLQTELARQRASRADALYRLNLDLATARDQSGVADIAVKHVLDNFSTSAVLLLADAEQGLAVDMVATPPISLQGLEIAGARQAFEREEIVPVGDLIFHPLKGAKSGQGVLAIKASGMLAERTPELSTFIDTFCHLIAQTLERLRLAAQAREAAIQADAEALRNALLSSISHDLRTPLTRIIGAAATVIERHGELATSERQDLQIVLDEAQRMAELTDKLLDMARMSSEQIVLHCDWNMIEEIVGSALNRLNKSLHDRPVRTRLPDSLPLLWIDAVLMEQVLVNLIENAIKYSPPGSPIDIEASSLAASFRLTIVDYGAGIAKDQVDKVFQKFYRCHPESEQGGVGLGLALCKVIVEAHGGCITAGNRPGKGAEFVIELPFPHAPPAPVEAETGEG